MYRNFVSIINASGILIRSNAYNTGVTESSINTAAFFFRDDLEIKERFLRYIDEDQSPIDALKKLANDVRVKLMQRSNFLAQVPTDIPFSKYEKFELQYHENIEKEYLRTLEIIDYKIKESVTEYNPEDVRILGYTAWQIIEQSLKSGVEAVKMHRKDLDYTELFAFIGDVRDSWESAFFKRQPNNFTRSVSHLIMDVDKTTITKGKKAEISALHSMIASLSMVLDGDFKDKFILETASMFRGDVYHTKVFCTTPGIMDRRTFNSRIAKEPLKSAILHIKEDVTLTIPL